MYMTPEEVKQQLPIREFWFIKELVKVFKITPKALTFTLHRHSIGRKLRMGPKGVFIVTEDDLEELCKHVYGKGGNPEQRMTDEEKIAAVRNELKNVTTPPIDTPLSE